MNKQLEEIAKEFTKIVRKHNLKICVVFMEDNNEIFACAVTSNKSLCPACCFQDAATEIHNEFQHQDTMQ